MTYRSALPFALFLLPILARPQSCAFSLGPDRTLCDGENVLLAGPSGSVSIHWQNGWAVQYLTADTPGTYWCTATFPVPGQDLVVNGAFSNGNTGFTTDLALGMGGTWGPISLEGTYGLSTDISLLHSNFPSCGDHTGSNGQMLVVNGSATPNADIWCQTIAVQPNTTYAFSAWLMSASPESPAILDFAVNGVSIGAPLLASSTTCDWDEFYAVWNAGSSTTATICITNQNLAQSGNDFALDDIAFRPLCTHTDSVLINFMPPEPEIIVTGPATLCPGDLAVLQASLDPPWPAPVDMIWNTGAGGSSYTASTTGLFSVTATATCLEATGSLFIAPDTCVSTLTMPNVFTPNGDGSNDVFLPLVVGQPTDFEMEIRNRWGQVIFRSTNVNTGWDGRIQGEWAADGTYYWTVRYSDRLNDGRLKQQDRAGHLTLLGRP
ncbi:MAG: gliding motility-associated C-terminal domain-containing protein [Flavobacteriales bacterium]|nr:gliding motility-associated C-terminal domain-containing protein [Flavobacteriales bacterium]